MHLSPFIKKLVSVLGIAFIVTGGWLCYMTGTVTGNEPINQTKDNFSHSSSVAMNKSVPSPLVNSDLGALSDYSDLQQLTQGLHPGRGDPIPDAEDVHELPVADVSFYNRRHN